ncbi:flagellin [Novosphingobium sp.]|uniref:flagellin N-terminal helical domain-containing protein n=1 Tax=Novosphingobium sp. TaxID=1874826 RepID=UPI003D0B0127
MTISTATSTAAFYSTATQQLSSLQAQANAVNQSISTGNQYAAASENPEAAAQMRMLQLADATAAVDTTTANKATSTLQLADATMTTMVNDMNTARALATQAANGTLSDTDRAAIGTQMAQIQADMISLANTTDSSGNALFGGGVSGSAYTTDASGKAVYGGAATSQTLGIGGGQSVQTSLTGPDIFNITDANGNSTNVMDAIGALATALKAGGTAAQTAASNGLTTLSNGLDAVTTAQTVIGARESWIALNTQNLTAQGTARATAEKSIGDTDISSAAIRLQQLTTALQASQSCFVRLSSLSLFNVIGN